MVRDVDNGGGYACAVAGSIWELFIPSGQFCCEPALKNKVYYIFKKMKMGTILRMLHISPENI